MIVYYENSMGEVFDLSDFPANIEDIQTLFGRTWEYKKTDLIARNASDLEKFYRTHRQEKIIVQIFADSEEEYKKLINRFHEITEKDIIQNHPGKLWINDYYMPCYLNANEIKEFDELYYYIKNEVTLTSFDPFWINKRTYKFQSYKDKTDTKNKKYPYKFPFRYGGGGGDGILINDHYMPSNFKLYIFGRVINPMVIVGENRYLVNTIVEEGEYIEIDSKEETVKKVLKDGQRENLFHYREKGKRFFEKIKPGRQQVKWTGKFDFEIEMYEERSEPKW